MAAGTFWQHSEKICVGFGKAQLFWGHWRQTSSGTAKIDVGWLNEIPTVLLHWKTQLWGAWGVLPTWRELVLWLHSVFLGLGEIADLFSQLKTHWTCLHGYVLAAIPLLWQAIKATEPACQAQGLCLHSWEMVLCTKHSTCITETYQAVQEPHETTKGFLLMSSPWSSPTDPNEGTELEREEGQLKF